MFSCFLTLVLFSLGSVSVEAKAIAEDALTKHYAYMNLETADSSTQEAILAARNTLMNEREWTADDFELYVVDREGNVIRKIPTFSEIFPADWELPDSSAESQSFSEQGALHSVPLSEYPPQLMQFTDQVTLRKPNHADAVPFRVFKGEETFGRDKYKLNYLSVVCNGMIAYHTFNLGFTDMDHNKSITSEIRLSGTQGLTCPNPGLYKSVGVRASSYDIGGAWDFSTFARYLH